MRLSWIHVVSRVIFSEMSDHIKATALYCPMSLSEILHGEQYQCHLVPSCRHVWSFDPCFYIAPVCCEFMPSIVDRGLSRVLRPRTQITCLLNAIDNSSCAISDQACVCYDEDLNVQATACIMESCTVREALSTKNLTATSCGIAPNIGASYVPLFMAMTALCAVSILLRVVARLKAGYPVWWDDFIIGVSFVGSTLHPEFLQPHYCRF